ncbi:TPA: hypothetical protein ACOEQU_003802 [Stenotrophomonas maltophilia]
MNYLGLALYAEGSTDYYFLQPLLRRLSEDVMALRGRAPAEVSDVLGVDHPESAREERRDERIRAAAAASHGSWNIFFIHADGSGDAERAKREQADPGILALQPEHGVAVIPVKETEAWAMADGEALRKAFGCTLSDVELGVPPQAADVQKIADPKKSLEEALGSARGGARRKRAISQYLGTIGETVSMERLRQVPSFAATEQELVIALQKLGLIE